MELKIFIATTLAAIVEGVVEAQKRVQPHGAHVNPGGLMRTTKSISPDALWDNRTNNMARVVSFDVALTEEESASTGAKAGVEVLSVVKLGAGGASENKESTVSRVQFSIPLLLPHGEVLEGARQAKK